MTKTSYQWWDTPKSQEEIPQYLDRMLKYAGDNMWAKIMRDSIQKKCEEDLNPSKANSQKKGNDD